MRTARRKPRKSVKPAMRNASALRKTGARKTAAEKSPAKIAALPKLLTIAEAAQEARISKPSIVRAYRSGQLRVFRSPGGGIVRVFSDSLVAWIERNSYGGKR